MQLVDTHCHIHFKEFGFVPDNVINNAADANVGKMICVGCSLDDSKSAVEFSGSRSNVWASVGAHPHNGAEFLETPNSAQLLVDLAKNSKVIAIGEIGLDYYKCTVDKKDQEKTLTIQIEATIDLGLPYIFHIREAWSDFWKVLDNYPGISGVVHSFSSTRSDLEDVLKRDLYVGLNGIITFTKIAEQLEAAKLVPSSSLLLETDAPFLTPKPYRGHTCEPKHILNIAQFLAGLRSEELDDLASSTTNNAERLFRI